MSQNYLTQNNFSPADRKTQPLFVSAAKHPQAFGQKQNTQLTQGLLNIITHFVEKNPEHVSLSHEVQDLLAAHQVPATAQESTEFLAGLTDHISQSLAAVEGETPKASGFEKILSGELLLKAGSENSQEVGELQALLRQWGYKINDHGGKYRGIFGPQTEKAVKQFQKSAGLSPDGVVGPKTLNALVNNDPVKLPDGIGLKPGAVIHSLHSKIVESLPHVEAAWAQADAPKPVITSGNDSLHKPNSKHYKDRAIDLRGNNVSDKKMKQIAQDLQNRLGSDYLVIAEFFPPNPANDHIHIQYNGK